MTKDEIRITKEGRSTNDERIHLWGESFGLRVSAFVISAHGPFGGVNLTFSISLKTVPVAGST